MLVEFNILPLGGDTQLSDEIAEVLQIVEKSDLNYQLTPSGTCIEGEWDEVMALVKKCHKRMRKHSDHVFTMIKIEDEKGANTQLISNVRSVEKKVGKQLQRLPSIEM
ncbi:MAG: MTH1187 family thiamine-binding protein, partial [Anaerolineales bacterium]